MFFNRLFFRVGFLGGLAVKNLLGMKETQVKPWVRKVPWRRAWQPTPVFLLGESHGQRSLAGYSPRGGKELDMTGAAWHACRLGEAPIGAGFFRVRGDGGAEVVLSMT